MAKLTDEQLRARRAIRLTRAVRVLGADMVADGWQVIGDGPDPTICWLHEPSHRVVSVESCPWHQCRGIEAIPSPPANPTAEGWVVAVRIHDDLGNPTAGTCLWTENRDRALRLAVENRRLILAGAA